MYGKFIQKAPEIILHPPSPNAESIRTSPLIKSFTTKNDKLVYEYYNDIDFQYNYTMVASLLLAQQRKNMYDVFMFCKEKNIPMYYSAADSIAIPKKDYHHFVEAGYVGSELGQFKIEAEGEVGIFVKRGLYYCGMSKIVSGLDADIIHNFAEEHGLTVEQLFRNMVTGESYTLHMSDGKIRRLEA